MLVSVILDSHKQHELTRFEQVVGAMPEVVECNYVAGQFDYLLKVVARDMNDYLRVMDDLMEAFGKLNQFSSYIVMRKTKEQEMAASYLFDKGRRQAS